MVAETSPSVDRPVNVTENCGLCPVSATGKVARLTILLAGIATLVQAVIFTPEEFLTVTVADVYADTVTNVNVRHA